jgi:hypothetical protein
MSLSVNKTEMELQKKKMQFGILFAVRLIAGHSFILKRFSLSAYMLHASLGSSFCWVTDLL